MYIDELIDNNITKKDILTIVAITRQVHLVNDLKVKVLIDNDMIIFKKVLFDFDRQELRINSCKDLRTQINTKAKESFFIKQFVKLRIKTTISPFKIVDVSIILKSLLLDRDFLFESIY